MADPVTFVDYVRAPTRSVEFATECETSATALVDALIGARTVNPVLRRQAIFLTGANLYQRRQRLTEQQGSSDGTVQFSPDRPTRDPLDAARHLLRNELGPGIA